jgi:hypothetical protein
MYTIKMKIAFVATIVALISLSLSWTTQAAPTQSRKINPDSISPIANTQLLKLIISKALLQQEDSSSTKDKDMAATFCRLMVQIINKLKFFNAEFGEGSVDDYCEDFELPPEPKPEEKNAILAKTYQKVLNVLKNIGLNGNNIYGNLING